MSNIPEQSQHYSAYELLTWYRQAGVDIALNDDPVNQFAAKDDLKKPLGGDLTESKPKGSNVLQNTRSGRPRLDGQARSAAAATDTRGRLEIPDASAVSKAVELAAQADTLEELKKILTEFTGCNLRLSAKNMVFGTGDPAAKVMMIGEAPDRDEDLHGEPFVGRSGQMLDKMLAAIGLDRNQVYLSNIIPWRPPGNRTPTSHEIEICRPFFERHIHLVEPELIVLLGSAAKILLKENLSIVKLRGKSRTIEINGRKFETYSMFHPSNLVGHPEQKKRSWRDLINIRKCL